MDSTNLTKITCRPADNKFTVLFLRQRKISKEELNLRPSIRSTLKIFNPMIKSLLLSAYEDFKQSKLDLADYFQVNIILAVSREKSNEFNLRKTKFDESKRVWKLSSISLISMISMIILSIFRLK